MARLLLEPYLSQLARWPSEGRHVLAQFDEVSIVVYQAYRPSIGAWAIERQRFGGPAFSFERMSWIKPNFLWMMYRSGWGTKQDQQSVLGLRVHRSFFDETLRRAVPSSFDGALFATPGSWREALSESTVRLQWDPDHLPSGERSPRRAVQLGLRGAALRELVGSALLEVIDMNEIVRAGREQLKNDRLDLLQTPTEHVYHWPQVEST